MASLNHYHHVSAILFSFFLVVGLLRVESSAAQSVTGTTGLFSTPTARVMPDKTVSAGFYFFPGALSNYSRDGLYDNGNFHATLTFLPRLEVMFRYTRMLNLDAESRESIFMDRMMTARILIFREGRHTPGLLIGFQDFGGTFGTTVNNHFGANYVVASKSLEMKMVFTDLSIGYAYDLENDQSNTMSGIFAGLEFKTQKDAPFSFIAEYDSHRLNAAVKLHFRRVQVMTGLMGMKYVSGGMSIQYPI